MENTRENIYLRVKTSTHGCDPITRTPYLRHFHREHLVQHRIHKPGSNSAALIRHADGEPLHISGGIRGEGVVRHVRQTKRKSTRKSTFYLRSILMQVRRLKK